MTYFGFKSDYLIILDTLSSNELQTGRNLDEEINDCINEKKIFFSCFQWKCQEYNDFLNAINKIKIGIMKDNKYPCIHIEGHSSSDGLKFDNKIVAWDKIRDQMKEINFLCKNNLFLSIAACSSAFLYKKIYLSEPAPFFAILAPKREIEAGDLVKIFSSFYCSLISNGSLNEAKITICENKGNNDFLLKYTYAHFIQESKKYIASYNRKKRQKNIECLITKSKKILPDVSLKEKRKLVRKNQNKDLILALEHFHDIFTMINYYPENKDRFIFNTIDMVSK